ncbi:MAG: response regulator [Bryobacteraceae bacterium]
MNTAPTARILIVDDEPSLLALMEQLLTRLGYRVEAFSSAEQALERFEADPARYSLLVADFSLPGISGLPVILTLLERNSRLRVLICTGAPFDISAIPEPLRARAGYLQKPFAPPALADSIKRLLEPHNQSLETAC